MNSAQGDQDLLAQWRFRISEQLERGVALLQAPHPAFADIVRYVLMGGGKRLRALLTLSIAADLGGQGASERGLWCVAALEALHAASLVHDDLPALDDDDLRRGQPACHKAYGEASAILVGDYLVGAAFEWVTGPTAEIDVASQAGVCRLLARAWSAVCIGQHIDITANLAASAVSSVRRDELYRLKTGALFGAAAACAGVLAAAPATCVEELHSWGVSLGVAFQHLDDLRDGELHPTQAQPIVPTAQGCQLQLEQLLKIPCPITAQVLGLVLE